MERRKKNYGKRWIHAGAKLSITMMLIFALFGGEAYVATTYTNSTGGAIALHVNG